jgi:hypothetical protein
VKDTLMVIMLFTMYIRSFADESKTYKPMEAIIRYIFGHKYKW